VLQLLKDELFDASNSSELLGQDGGGAPRGAVQSARKGGESDRG